MGTHINATKTAVKTTIDIADDLISRAKLVQKRDGVTLRALVEDGLRLVLDRDSRKPKYRFVPVVAGTPYRNGMAAPDVNVLIAEANERGWAEHEVRGVAEPRATYVVRKKKAPVRKRRTKPKA